MPAESVNEFDSAGNRRDSLDIIGTPGLNVFAISGTYSYGFDIRDRYGCTTEIETDGSDTAIYHLVNGFAGEARPPEPAEKVDTIVLPPDVTKLSSDDLFAVVANYDVIHRAAKEELNKRINNVAAKLA